MDLKKKRLEKKMTQVDVAKEVGVSVQTYQLWEKEASTPKAENMGKLRKVLGLERGGM